jgi:hypothetical protein
MPSFGDPTQTSGVPTQMSRPPASIPGMPTQISGMPTQTTAVPSPASGVNVSTRLIHLDHGLFGLSLVPGPSDLGSGLPGVRLSTPPGIAARRDAVSFSSMHADGWLGLNDEPTLIRVAAGGAEVLVTLYWSPADGGASPPALRLIRLSTEPVADTPRGPPAPVPPAPVPPPRTAEIVAHVQDFGDVEGALGEWVGRRGSGRWIEGFGLNPRLGLAIEDLECRAVLGRDWMSPWLPGGQFCGSRGLALPLRGFCLRLRSAAAARFDLVASARFVDGTEIGPVGADRICAAPSLAALEAFQVVLQPRMG